MHGAAEHVAGPVELDDKDVITVRGHHVIVVHMKCPAEPASHKHVAAKVDREALDADVTRTTECLDPLPQTGR